MRVLKSIYTRKNWQHIYNNIKDIKVIPVSHLKEILDEVLIIKIIFPNRPRRGKRSYSAGSTVSFRAERGNK